MYKHRDWMATKIFTNISVREIIETYFNKYIDMEWEKNQIMGLLGDWIMIPTHCFLSDNIMDESID